MPRSDVRRSGALVFYLHLFIILWYTYEVKIKSKNNYLLMKNFKKVLFQTSISIFIFMILLMPVLSLAQPGGAGGPPTGSPGAGGPAVGNNYTTITNPINVNSIEDFVKKLLEGIIKIGIPIIAIAIIYSGFLFVAAGGKPGKIEEAKSAFVYTLIGAAILLGSWALAQLITDTVTQL